MDSSPALDRQITAEVQAAVATAGLSQRELALKSGIPLATLARRLSGMGKGFTVSEVIAVADVLGISLVELALRAERSAARTAA